MSSEMGFTVLMVMSGTPLYPIPSDYEERFAAGGIRLVCGDPALPMPDMLALAPHANAVLMASGRYPAGDVLFDGLPCCRLIVRMGAGYDNVDVRSATRHQVLVSNMPGSIHEDVSDHTAGLILTCQRRIALLDRPMHDGRWEPNLAAPIRRLRGQTLGFVGFGRIARAVAEKMAGFGLHYIAVDPLISGPVEVAGRPVEIVSFDEVLSRADIVSVHTPSTTQTYRLVGRREFALMRPDAIFINTSRGAVVDEAALVESLEKGRPAAVGLDVFDPEPPLADNPLRRFPNVVLTPHVAGYSLEVLRENHDTAHHLVSEFLLHGHPPRWAINPEVLAPR